VVPTNEGQVMVGIQWPRAEFDTVRRDIERCYLDTLYATAPPLMDRIQAGTREARFVGTGRLPNFFRQAYGPGWALVGDAGYHKDPVGAYGISDALAHAELLAHRLDEGLRGDRPVDEALAEYAEERDRESMPRYQFNLEAAKFDPLPELLNVLRTVEGDQEYMDRFFGLLAGVLSMEQFFTEDLIDRAMGVDAYRAAGPAGPAGPLAAPVG
jgi:flavin-dependent dehydrogenase